MCHPDPGAPFSGHAVDEEEFTLQGADPIKATRYRAPSGKGAPGIVLIHDVYGHTPFYREMGKRLAAAGFTTVLPDLFHRQGPIPDRDREAAMARRARFSAPIALLDLAAAARYLREQEEAPRVGALGFCMGGTLVLLLAAREPLDAGVVYYGFPFNRNRTDLAPFQPLDEVTQLNTPLLGFWGDQDAGVGMENVRRFDEALTRHGKPHEIIIYPGLPHGFLTFDPDAQFGRESRDSWDRTIRFFHERLHGMPAGNSAATGDGA